MSKNILTAIALLGSLIPQLSEANPMPNTSCRPQVVKYVDEKENYTFFLVDTDGDNNVEGVVYPNDPILSNFLVPVHKGEPWYENFQEKFAAGRKFCG